ncbi:hypothetical protein [Paracoccus sulfuroxidans]|uniref:Uncharacterized protein n=1 Tax=Paracoccus sulfuroxidans TaxID=384678 RepID=A0A562N573_9RHOB|nr:hypothetical protein [Paracoccus sulfuroxidans]TWI27021.1 hypothetical protein IQ24_03989 [Paracoccus sulfuroxidans]
MIDLPPDPIPYVMIVEYEMNDLIALSCGDTSQNVSRADAGLYAEALDRFLEDPDNLARVDRSFYSSVLAPRRLEYDTERQKIYFGRWKLQCNAPDTLSWHMQPVASTEFTAYLGYDERNDTWHITDLRVMRMRR